MAKVNRCVFPLLCGGEGLGVKGGLAILALVVLSGCGKDENSPDMGAAPPKPNMSAAANAPGGASPNARPGADAAAMAQVAHPKK